MREGEVVFVSESGGLEVVLEERFGRADVRSLLNGGGDVVGKVGVFVGFSERALTGRALEMLRSEQDIQSVRHNDSKCISASVRSRSKNNEVHKVRVHDIAQHDT